MTAIYCRQSVEKKDSISIETQEQECRSKLKKGDTDVAVYSDRGYSGKDINRPDFQRLMSDVKAGIVSKIIVYKLDRISRSVLDFELTYRELKQHHVDFVSATEDFDTTSITGEAMLRVILIFAQLERETIQKRVTDNFYSRAEKGFYMAGIAPLGYRKVAALFDGKASSMLEEDVGTSSIIKFIYQSYLAGNSIGKIASRLNSTECEIKHDIRFNNVRISRILANPVYVKANADVYSYFKSKGAVLHNDVGEFTGSCGCTIYGRRQGKTKSKYRNLQGENIQLNRHEGLISADDWLRVQYLLSNNKALKNSGSGKHSWLSGMIKCGFCGYAISVVNGQSNGKRYVYCGGRKNHTCSGCKGGLTFDEIESAVAEKMLEHARQIHYHSANKANMNSAEINSLKARKIKLEEEINSIVESFAKAHNDLLCKKLNEKMNSIEQQLSEIKNELLRYSAERTNTVDADSIYTLLEDWDRLEMEDKKNITRLLLSRITVWDKNTPIEVKFTV